MVRSGALPAGSGEAQPLTFGDRETIADQGGGAPVHPRRVLLVERNDIDIETAQKLEEILGSHGLKRFGAVGEEFDPNLHEALMHEDADDVETATISLVMQPGYQMNDRVLRPARVGTRGPA